MELYNDDIRREAKAIQAEHEATMGTTRELVKRLFAEDSRETVQTKADVVLGGFNRRRFIQVGGLSILTTAVLAACGGGGGEAEEGATETTETTQKADASDITLLRTASSLEELAVAAYQMAIDSGNVKTESVANVAKLFQQQHKDHSNVLQDVTKDRGGEPFDQPNQAILDSLKAEIDTALQSEAGILGLALKLEQVAAATYQSSVGQFKDLSLGQTAMSIGTTEARHVALLSHLQQKPGVPAAFQKTDGAVPAGTGVGA